MINQHEKINYIEFPSRDLAKTKAFFTKAFEWTFTDYGPEYSAGASAGIGVGFYQSDLLVSIESGSALVVFYSIELEQTMVKIQEAGGEIVRPIFPFPGGRRFHFCDPTGNEYAVWSDRGLEA